MPIKQRAVHIFLLICEDVECLFLRLGVAPISFRGVKCNLYKQFAFIIMGQ